MTEVLQANLFFFITAVSVVVFTIFLCVAMYFVIKILRSVNNITERIDEGSETIAEDIKQLRNYVAQGSLISQIIGLFVKSKRSRKRESADDQ
jgi:predicted PurR-regulated permease PerM